jgi:hypothetical protein
VDELKPQRILFGGPDSRRIVHRGEFACSFQYVDEEPTLIFAARYRNNRVPNPPVIAIPLSQAWKWNEPDYVAQACFACVGILGFEQATYRTVKFAEFVNDMLQDLVEMKPLPESMRQTVEVEVQNEGDRTRFILH